jgi:MFS transporter, DHA1 family, multidrug resistance protein
LSEPFLGMAFGLHALLFNLHLLAHQVTEVEIGSITAIGSLVMALVAIPFGILADRIGRKKVLVSGLSIITVSHYTIAFGSTFEHFLLAQFILSFGMAMMIAAEIPLLFKYCQTSKQETQTYNMMFAVFTFFTGLGTLIGGYLPRLLDGQHEHYQGTMIFMAITMTIVTLARFFLPEEGKIVPKKEEEKHRFKLTFKNIMPNKKLLIYAGFSVFSGAAFAFLIPFFNIIIKFRLEWTDSNVAILLTLNGLILSLASFMTPYLLDKWGLKRVSFALFALTISASFLLALTIPLSLFLVFFIMRSGVFTALFNVIEGQALQATDDRERSLHASLRSIGRSLGATAAAYIAGIILGLGNYWLPFFASGFVVFLAFFYFQLFMLKPLQYDLEKKDVVIEKSS